MFEDKGRRIYKLVSTLATEIEKTDCSYKEALTALEALKENYVKKGQDLLDQTGIQKVAETGGLLG